jgi:hypothetical protein
MKPQFLFICFILLTLPLTGCLGGQDVVEEASASQEGLVPTTSSTGQTASGSVNLPPVITAYLGTVISDVQGSDCTTVGFEVQGRHAMTDWDNNITQAGWDVDLDGTIDYPVTAAEGFTALQVNLVDMVLSNESRQGDNYYFQTYAEAHVAFGALDESGAWASSGLIKIRKLIEGYNSNQDTTYSYIDTEPCADFNDVTEYNFSVSDHADFASDGSTDYLVTISRTNGQNGINWNRVRIFFDGSDEGDEQCYQNYYRCELLPGDGLSNSSSLGAMWEAGESVTIKENGNNMHREGYEAEITIYIDNVLVFSESIMVN